MDIYELTFLLGIFMFRGNLQYLHNHDIKLVSENHGILTVTHCPTLLAIEREGSSREKGICQVVESFIFKKYAGYFDPKIEVETLKIPPRENRGKGEICCQWQFKV